MAAKLYFYIVQMKPVCLFVFQSGILLKIPAVTFPGLLICANDGLILSRLVALSAGKITKQSYPSNIAVIIVIIMYSAIAGLQLLSF